MDPYYFFTCFLTDGIGTTSPGDRLHILATTDGGGITIQSGGSSTYASGLNLNNYAGNQTAALGIANSANNYIPGSVANDTVLKAPTNLLFGTASGERMRINSSGNVGIGTSVPTKQLHIVSTNAMPQLLVQKSGSTGLSLSGWYPGIGFNTVYDGSSTWQAVGTGYAGSLGQNPSTGVITINSSGSSISAGNNINATSLMTILPGGNVGIGTTNPGSTLDVAGTIKSNGKAVVSTANSGTRIESGTVNLGSVTGWQTATFTFSTAFTGTPVCVWTPHATSMTSNVSITQLEGAVGTTPRVTTTSCTAVFVVNNGSMGVSVDFMAIGQ